MNFLKDSNDFKWLTGEVKDRIILIRKKLKRGKTLDVIADELESTVEEVKPLYNAVIKCPVDMDPEEIAKSII